LAYYFFIAEPWAATHCHSPFDAETPEDAAKRMRPWCKLDKCRTVTCLVIASQSCSSNRTSVKLKIHEHSDYSAVIEGNAIHRVS
jgi:hypothetical protein